MILGKHSTHFFYKSDTHHSLSSLSHEAVGNSFINIIASSSIQQLSGYPASFWRTFTRLSVIYGGDIAADK